MYLKRTNSNRNPVWINLVFTFSKETIIELVHKLSVPYLCELNLVCYFEPILYCSRYFRTKNLNLTIKTICALYKKSFYHKKYQHIGRLFL